jgi:hypothetical protein
MYGVSPQPNSGEAMRKKDKWGLDVPTSIEVRNETDYATCFWFGRMNQLMQIDTNPRSRAVHTIELSKLETLSCVDVKGRPCRGIDMVRRFNCERSYGERLQKAAGILLGFEDKFDLRRYIPVDARICRRVPDVFGIFDHLMSRLGIPPRMERCVRFFIDGSLFRSPSGAEQWTAYAYKTLNNDGEEVYRCNRFEANLLRREHDYSLVLG